MEQLSIRDWMILIGGIMIAAVLIDAVRRYWGERRAEIKLNARIERAAPLSDDDDAFNLLTELPNGGARIVHRDDLQIDPKARAPISEASAAGPDRADLSSGDEPAPDPIDVAVAAELAETSDTGSTQGAEKKRSIGLAPLPAAKTALQFSSKISENKFNRPSSPSPRNIET